MIQIAYRFHVEVDMPAGPGAKAVEVLVDFDTTDIDHALELADRHVALHVPHARIIPGTLQTIPV